MRFSFLLLLFLGLVSLGLLSVACEAAEDPDAIETKLEQKEKAYQAQQTRLTAAQQTLSRLEGEVRLAEAAVASQQQHLDMSQQKLQQKIQLFFDDTRVSFEPEKQAYIAVKQAVQESRQALTRQRQKAAQASSDVKTMKTALRSLAAERRRLRQSMAEARFEQLRQQIEREQVVEVKGEFSCGKLSISDCKRQALLQAQRNAVERGSAVLVRSASEVKNFALTQDDLRTQVEAFVLRHKVIQEGFVGASGYFYTIRATVQGKAGQGLRLQLLSEYTDENDIHEKARALLRQAIGFYTGASGRIDMSRAKALLMQAAELEDALAIMWLARCYHRGCAGFRKDLQHSRQLAAQVVQEVERLAYIGDAQALFLFGAAYHAGLAVKPDPQQALSWYRKAAEQGHLIAQRTLGVMYVKGRGVARDEAEAANWFRKSAEQGDATAQYNLGAMYVSGSGVPRSDAEAIQWFRQAAERGDAAAQYNLAVMYDHGRGIPRDDAEAVQWYRKAAEQNDSAAQYHLGFKYERGEGVAQSRDDAVRWYRRAAEHGNAEAQQRLQKLLSRK
ncbi:MAG: hypothetical protein OEU26_17640 [Candidatus Tectomicrobia bacterium]|nr:hypothetical protein [Candidatus Tectomicrobia bacterium]